MKKEPHSQELSEFVDAKIEQILYRNIQLKVEIYIKPEKRRLLIK